MGTTHSELVTALEAGDARAVRTAILHHNIRVDTVFDAAGRPILCEAARRGNLPVVQALVNVGHGSVNARTPSGDMAIFDAVLGGSVPVVEFLCSSGAALDVTDKNGFSPAHLAAMNGNADVLGALISKGAPINLESNAKDTPLHLAARNGHTLCVKMLVDSDAKLYVRNLSHETPLDLATKCYKAAVMDILEEAQRKRPVSDVIPVVL
jgi:ankyrin repeat protein